MTLPDDLLQKVGAILDEGEEALERDEEAPPPRAEPGDRERDEGEEEGPEEAVEEIGAGRHDDNGFVREGELLLSFSVRCGCGFERW